MGFVYGVEPKLSAHEFRRLLIASGLAERRPFEDLERLDRMLRSASLILTARAYTPERTLLGAARVLTDYAHSAYVPDLAVAQTQQRNGIGRGLLAALREKLGPQVGVTVSAGSEAGPFCERIGMARMDGAYRFTREL